MQNIFSLESLFWAVWVLLGIYGVLIAVQLVRNRIPPGKARYMGIPATIFVWMNIIYGIVLFEGVYGFFSVILNFPLWIDIALFILIATLAMILYIKLQSRKKFKPNLFVALFLVPLSIPGIHNIAKWVRNSPPPTITYADDSASKILDYLRSLFYWKEDRVEGSGYDIVFPNPVAKGTFGDWLSAIRLAAQGYRKLESKRDASHGLDGVYAKYDKDGELQQILLVESKTDSSKLRGGQMTDEWVDETVQKMLVHPNEAVRRTGELIMDNRHLVQKQLWHHNLGSGTTSVYILDGQARRSLLRTENYMGKAVRRRCESANPSIQCVPSDPQRF